MKKYILTLFALLFFISCEKELVEKRYNNILVLGNSITKHAPLEEVGWYGDWGMAASEPKYDFVHVLGKRLGSKIITPVNISAFEVHHTSYNLNLLDNYLTTSVDLIVIKIGENVNDITLFDISFKRLIKHIQTKSPRAKIIVGGSFWRRDSLDNIMKITSISNNIPFIELYQLDTEENRSFIGDLINVNGKTYPVIHQGVASHPGNLGMKRIADLFYSTIYPNSLSIN